MLQNRVLRLTIKLHVFEVQLQVFNWQNAETLNEEFQFREILSGHP